MRCPDCQAELPEGTEICRYCFALLVRAGGQRAAAPPSPPPAAAFLPSDTSLSEPDEPSRPPLRRMRTGAGRTSRSSRGLAAVSPPPRPPSSSLPPLPSQAPRPAPAPERPAQARVPERPAPPQVPQRPVEVSSPESGKASSFGPPTGQGQIKTRMIEVDLQENKGTQIVEISLPAAVRRKVRQAEEEGGSFAGADRAAGQWQLEVEESEVSHGVDEALRLLRLFYARLHRLDRWGIKVLIAAFISSFLPWIHVRGEGLKAGVETLGAISAAGAAAALVCVYLRTIHRRSAVTLILLQLLLAALITAAPIYRFLSFGGEDLQLSFGIFLTALAGAVTVLLSLLRLALIGA